MEYRLQRPDPERAAAISSPGSGAVLVVFQPSDLAPKSKIHGV